MTCRWCESRRARRTVRQRVKDWHAAVSRVLKQDPQLSYRSIKWAGSVRGVHGRITTRTITSLAQAHRFLTE